MSQEPVKLVVFVSGGVVQNILTCGIPIEVALVDYDVDNEDEAVSVPDITDGFERARVTHWIIDPMDQDSFTTNYAMQVFGIAETKGDAA